MTDVQDHYDRHLGPIYEWMAGPFEEACAPSAKLFEELDLRPGALFITTFRDYVSSPLQGDARFIPVRSDDHRTLTCFLEYQDTTVRVRDLLHERTDSGWKLTVSSYKRLRINPGWLVEVLRSFGLQIVLERTERGLVTLTARSRAGSLHDKAVADVGSSS